MNVSFWPLLLRLARNLLCAPGPWGPTHFYSVGRQLALEFLAEEEEQFVLRPPFKVRKVNRAANGITHIVVTEQWLRQVSGVVEECVRVKAIVAVLPIAATMKLFGAALVTREICPLTLRPYSAW